jgi:hypothetical protein
MVIAAAAVAALFFSYRGLKSTEKTQAYTYWQDFLQLCVDKSEMANGLQMIDSIPLSKFSNLTPRDSLYKSAQHDTFVQYAWFVSNALNAAEVVYNLQRGDVYWENTLIDVLSYHSAYFETEGFNWASYEPDFAMLMEKAIVKGNSGSKPFQYLFRRFTLIFVKVLFPSIQLVLNE